jgi:16S rRNA (cytidine1402-2'-O)-methyltransferase
MSFEKNQSQIFIETPYRNNKLLEDLIQILNQTHLCIANRYHIANRYIKTKKIAAWKKKLSICINDLLFFIIHKM